MKMRRPFFLFVGFSLGIVLIDMLLLVNELSVILELELSGLAISGRRGDDYRFKVLNRQCF